MINVRYNEDGLKVNTYDLSPLLPQTKVKVKCVKQVTGKVLWETEIGSWSWAAFPDTEMIDVIIEDSFGIKIFEYKWDVLLHGSIFYKKLWGYCFNNPNSKGVVVGTHNGDFGEWVPLVKSAEMTLIEASKPQFDELVDTYKDYPNLKLINELITPDGENVIFYEGGRGYTNSVEQKVIEYWESEPYTGSERSSLKFKDFITPDVNWIHLDVEGIDDQLILSLDENMFDHIDVIIYENFNFDEDRKNKVANFLIEQGYTHHSENGIAIAEKLPG